MDSGSIKNELLHSSSSYYQWLKDNGKGVTKFQVTNIFTEDNILYKLSLKSNCNEVEFLQFILFNCQFGQSDIEITTYKQKELDVKPITEKARNLLKVATPADIVVVSDLSFLVKRVEQWYERYGHLVKIPNSNPTIIPNINRLEGSDEQKNAVKTATVNKLSYIWGAPGTGKTQFVLSNILTEYVEKLQKTIVTSPTNTALEQTMYGVLSMLQQSKIDRSKIVRLGRPSSKFSWIYPECCENDIALYWLARKIKFYTLYNAEQMAECMCSVNRQPSGLMAEHNERLVNTKRMQLSELKKQLENAEKTVTRIFKSRQIRALIKQIEEIETEINNIQADSLKPLIAHKYSVKDIKGYILTRVKEQEIYDLLQTATSIDELKEVLSQQLNRINVFDEAHTQMSEENLSNEIERMISERDWIISQTQESRIDNSIIVASTLDKYIGTFNDKSYFFTHCEHAFLDEAGYACLAKSLTLLSIGCPVTLLGDHLQLPPVCEASGKPIDEHPEFFPWDQSSIYIKDFINASSFAEAYGMYRMHDSPSFKDGEISILTQTFRFGSQLASILDKYVYKFGFTSRKDSETEIYCINAKANISRRENVAESYAIYEWMKDNSNESFAVITPYRDQVKSVKQICGLSDDQVMTIHKSQGKEWDTVIFSVSDTTNMFFTDSTKAQFNSLNLINTAVSRAKKKLIIVCDKSYWLPLKDTQFIGALVDVATEI